VSVRARPPVLAEFLQIGTKFRGTKKSPGANAGAVYCNPSTQGFFEGACRAVLHVGEHVGVGVQGDGYAGMPQHLGDNLRVDVLREQQRGARMPKIVKAYLGQARPLEQGLEEMSGDVAQIKRLTYLRGE
jgi:hypothetical protein